MRTMERPMPLYENMVLASSFEAALTVMRLPLFSSYKRHCIGRVLSERTCRTHMGAFNGSSVS